MKGILVQSFHEFHIKKTLHRLNTNYYGLTTMY